MDKKEIELRSKLAKEATINQIMQEKISLAISHLERSQTLNAYNTLKSIALEVDKIKNR